MPMYEYSCETCHDQFTLLRRMDQDDEDIVCPACGSNRIDRRFSVFAAFGKERIELTAQASHTGGGCCGGGTCGCA